MFARPELRIDWASADAVKYACTHWHYSKSVPVPPLVKVGAWEDGKFIGVVVFSRGATPSLLSPFGLSQTEGCELTRIALTKHSNAVSRIVKLAIMFLRKHNPGLRLIVSFADPSEGHHGGIYQAGNWIYSGKSASSTEYVGPDGKRWHARMVKSKGWTVVHGIKRKTLTPEQCTKVEKPGKHRYLMPLDAEMKSKILPLSKPYPRRYASASSEASEHHSEVGGAAPTRTLNDSPAKVP